MYCLLVTMINEVDNTDLADYLAGGQFDPSFEYNSKQKELNRDTRINKNKYVDVNAAYKELKHWQGSQEYQDTQKAKDLLSSFEIDASQLTKTLKEKYQMNDARCNSTLKNLANQKDVDLRRSTFDKTVKLRKRI